MGIVQGIAIVVVSTVCASGIYAAGSEDESTGSVDLGVYRDLDFWTDVRLEATAFVNPDFLDNVSINFLYRVPPNLEPSIYSGIIDGNIAVGSVEDGRYIVTDPFSEAARRRWQIEVETGSDYQQWVDASIPRFSEWSINLKPYDEKIAHAALDAPRLLRVFGLEGLEGFNDMEDTAVIRIDSLDTLKHWQEFVARLSELEADFLRHSYEDGSRDSLFDWTVTAETICDSGSSYRRWLDFYDPVGAEWLRKTGSGGDVCTIEIDGSSLIGDAKGIYDTDLDGAYLDHLPYLSYRYVNPWYIESYSMDSGGDGPEYMGVDEEAFERLYELYENHEKFQSFFDPPDSVRLTVESIEDIRAWRDFVNGNPNAKWSIDFPFEDYVFISSEPRLIDEEGQRVVTWPERKSVVDDVAGRR